MLTKILIFLGVVVGVLIAFRIAGASSAPRRRKPAPRVARAEELVPCPTCGAFIARGARCSCGEAPTP